MLHLHVMIEPDSVCLQLDLLSLSDPQVKTENSGMPLDTECEGSPL
jgi:hypothetical protein